MRVGTFQYFAARRDIDALRELADYVIARHYPAITDSKTPYLALLGAVAEAQASLVARWMQLGFIHGVMNTDNMQIAGETIDYGPCAFMDWYDPKTVYSSIDYMGRYAYVNQPAIAHWNLGCLAGALLPIIGDDQDTALEAAREVLEPFPTQFETAWLAGFRPKLGLTDADEEDAALIRDLLSTMHDASADFTLTFRALAHFATEPNRLYQLFPQPAGIDDWLRRWQQRLERETITGEEQHRLMRYANPAVIPRNHLVEQAIQSALDGDFNDFQRLLDATTNPFVEPDDAALTEPPEPEQVVRQTFCGT
ncbi:MAG: protein adenylyltransferase SelO family protein [Pseudomonadota bacterium]